MRRAPAVLEVAGDIEEVYAKGCYLITSGVRYSPGQVLYILASATGDYRKTCVASSFAGPLSSMGRDALEPAGFRSRGDVLDLLEADLGSSVDLDNWITVIHWNQ